MFKRVERKRKRREEWEEQGLDHDMRETIGLSGSESDESGSDSERENTQPDASDKDTDEDRAQGGNTAPEDESVTEDPIPVAEVLKDPIYLISLDPTVHGCVLCKGKLIKNTGMATSHKNAKVHKRRYEHFRLLSVDVDPRSDAWELVRAIRIASDVQRTESQELSKRALKRTAKQAVIREKRRRHKELRAKAIAKKAPKQLPTADERRPATPSEVNLRGSSAKQPQSKIRKKRK